MVQFAHPIPFGLHYWKIVALLTGVNYLHNRRSFEVALIYVYLVLVAKKNWRVYRLPKALANVPKPLIATEQKMHVLLIGFPTTTCVASKNHRNPLRNLIWIHVPIQKHISYHHLKSRKTNRKSHSKDRLTLRLAPKVRVNWLLRKVAGREVRRIYRKAPALHAFHLTRKYMLILPLVRSHIVHLKHPKTRAYPLDITLVRHSPNFRSHPLV